MDEDSMISSFLESLVDDKDEKMIIRLVSQDLEPEKILEALLSKRGGEKRA